MTIHTKKLNMAIQRYRDRELPPGESKTQAVERDLIKEHRAFREEILSDDNTELDSDPRDNFVSYSSGHRARMNYSLTDATLERTHGGPGYTMTSRYRLSESGMEVIHANYEGGNQLKKGSLSVAHVSADGRSVVSESWHIGVNPKFETIFSPSFDV